MKQDANAPVWQILTQEKPGDPWRFVAHGARFTEAEAYDMLRRMDTAGRRVRYLYCGKRRTRRVEPEGEA